MLSASRHSQRDSVPFPLCKQCGGAPPTAVRKRRTEAAAVMVGDSGEMPRHWKLWVSWSLRFAEECVLERLVSD